MDYTGKWTVEGIDLFCIIHEVYYKNDEYIKCRLSLFNTKNFIQYESHKSYKLKLNNIKHWKRGE